MLLMDDEKERIKGLARIVSHSNETCAGNGEISTSGTNVELSTWTEQDEEQSLDNERSLEGGDSSVVFFDECGNHSSFLVTGLEVGDPTEGKEAQCV